MLPVEIATYLAGAGLGLTIGTNLHHVPLPDSAPDLCVSIEEMKGPRASGTFGGSLSAPVFEYPRFHVIVRGSRDGAAAARQLAQDIYLKLDRLGPITILGVVYLNVSADGPVYGPDYDKNERPRYHLTCEATKDRS